MTWTTTGTWTFQSTIRNTTHQNRLTSVDPGNGFWNPAKGVKCQYRQEVSQEGSNTAIDSRRDETGFIVLNTSSTSFGVDRVLMKVDWMPVYSWNRDWTTGLLCVHLSLNYNHTRRSSSIEAGADRKLVSGRQRRRCIQTGYGNSIGCSQKPRWWWWVTNSYRDSMAASTLNAI